MKLENEFTVPASIDQAWAVLLDVPRVAPCLPGATVEPGGGEDGVFKGAMKIKIGPITASYKGTVKIEETDEAAHRVAMKAQAKDARGQGTAAATITSTMEEVADGTKVHVVTDMRITGPAASFGRGVMQDVSAKLMGRFADCLAEEMRSDGAAGTEAEAPAPEPAEAVAEPETEAEVEAPAPVEASTKVEDTGVAGASSGVSTAATEPKIPSASSGTSTASATRPTDDVLDLGEASREAVLKRALPLVGGVIALLILIRLIKR
jgi:carbon monoxide dehydrogenase subunit G